MARIRALEIKPKDESKIKRHVTIVRDKANKKTYVNVQKKGEKGKGMAVSTDPNSPLNKKKATIKAAPKKTTPQKKATIKAAPKKGATIKAAPKKKATIKAAPKKSKRK